MSSDPSCSVTPTKGFGRRLLLKRSRARRAETVSRGISISRACGGSFASRPHGPIAGSPFPYLKQALEIARGVEETGITVPSINRGTEMFLTGGRSCGRFWATRAGNLSTSRAEDGRISRSTAQGHSPAPRAVKRASQERQHSAAIGGTRGSTAPGEGFIIMCARDRSPKGGDPASRRLRDLRAPRERAGPA